MRDYGGKLNESEKENIRNRIINLKDVLQTSNREEIENRIQELQNASYTLSEKMYQQATSGQQASTEPQQEPPQEEPTAAGDEEKTETDTGGESGAVDADYEVIDEDEKEQE